MAGLARSLVLLFRAYSKILEVGEQAQNFIKDDLPANANPGAKWGQEVLRRTCRRVARADVPGIGVVNSPIWGEVCDPYLNSINEGPTSGGSYGPPFTGGQCYGANYYVTVRGPNRCDISGFYQATLVVAGPISGLSITTNPGYLGGCAGNPGDSRSVSVIGKDGQLRDIGLANIHKLDAPNYRITAVSPFNNAPNNCGNPPTQYNPPTYPTNLPTLPTPTNPAPGLGNGWDVTINPDGTFNICMGSECTPNINPDGSGPDTGEDPGDPDGSPQTNDPNNPNNNRISGCVGVGNILTGIKITFTKVPSNVSGPLNYYRNVAIIGFGPDSQKIDLVKDGSLMFNGQFVIPDSDFCRCYQVDVTPGWGLSVQAYSRPEKTE